VETPADQRRGDIRAKSRFVPGEVVGVGVGDERARFRVPWIEPQVNFGEVQASLKADFDHWGRKLGRDR
jgi:hypothetical protein